MTLERTRYPDPDNGKGRVFVTLTECPLKDATGDVCGYEFDENERRHQHLSTHDPEDADLSPLGTVHPDHDDPLFHPIDNLLPDTETERIHASDD